MSARNRVLLLCTVAVWAVFLLVTKPWRGDAHQRTAAHVGLLFPKLQYQTEEVRKVVVRDSENSVTLVFDDQRNWIVESKQHPMDNARLARLIANLAAVETLDVVSVNADKHEVYGVAEGQGTQVQVFGANGRLLADWIAGSLRHQEIEGGQKPVLEFYMRDGHSDVVYLSGSAIHPSVDAAVWCYTSFLKQVDDTRVKWVERTDFATGQSWRIERVPAADGTATVTGEWQLTAPTAQPALSYAGDSLAFSLTGLHAQDVVSQTNPDGADDARYGFPLDRFVVGIDDQTFEFELGKPAPAPGQRYLRIRGFPFIYTLGDYEVSQLRQPLERMLSQD